MRVREVVLASLGLAVVITVHVASHGQTIGAAIAARAFFVPVIFVSVRGGWKWGVGFGALGAMLHALVMA